MADTDRAFVAMLHQHLKASPGAARLDLSQAAPSALRLFTPEVARALGRVAREARPGPITEVRLPPGLDRLPEGLGALADLKQVEIPEFAGKVMDIRLLNPEASDRKAGPIHIVASGARVLETVEAWRGQPTGAVKAAHLRKVQVVRHTPGESSARTETLQGHAYVPLGSARKLTGAQREAAHTAARSTSHNMAVGFSDTGQLIVCRHLAIAYMAMRADHRAGKAAGTGPARFDFDRLSTPESIARTVTPATRALVDQVLEQPSGHHLVALNQWGPFLDSQFAGMAPGERRHLMLTSQSHAMAVELGVKKADEAGQPDRCIVRFYDPNATMADMRLELSRPDVIRSGFDDFQSAEQTAHYFNTTLDQAVAHAIVVDERLLRETATAPTQRTDHVPPKPADRKFAGPVFSAVSLGHAFAWSLTLGLADLLRAEIRAGRPGSAAAAALFNARDLDHLATHLSDGQPASIEALMVIASQVRPKAARIALLQAPRGHADRTRLLVPMANGRSDLVAAFIQALMAPEMGLTPHERAIILGISPQAPSSPAADCLTEAMAQDRRESVGVFLRAVADPRVGLSSAAKLELLGQRQADKSCCLLEALSAGHEQTAQSFVAAIADPSFGLSAGERASFYQQMNDEAAIDGVTAWPPRWLTTIDPDGVKAMAG